MKSDKSIVVVDKLTKKYDDKAVVDGISFSVREGEIFGILGPNGAGKTTTLEMIETLRPIDGGSVVLDGIDVSREPERVKALIGVQPQTASFEEKTRLTELLDFFASAYGEKVDAMKFLKDLQLENKAKSYAEQLLVGNARDFLLRQHWCMAQKFFFSMSRLRVLIHKHGVTFGS